ncbi:hypothetical protein GGX14DRAFT_401128 [Mycena pura]|uniref:Uncharacterized protein n=1 Tax=Mycena pura TaxID=153505 RepID=A0AAD6V4W7_9AGAR|nr:hypothetical protein GGX14DRAFT_401128 [Mycena pura]
MGPEPTSALLNMRSGSAVALALDGAPLNTARLGLSTGPGPGKFGATRYPNPQNPYPGIRITGVTYENFRIPSQPICGRPRDPTETFRMNFWTPVTYKIFSITLPVDATCSLVEQKMVELPKARTENLPFWAYFDPRDRFAHNSMSFAQFKVKL